MVEVFKTNVELQEHATLLVEELSYRFPKIKINFDLDDCDRVLRVEGNAIAPNKIIEALRTKGYYCELLKN